MKTNRLRSPFNHHNPAVITRREQVNTFGVRLALTLVVALLLTNLIGFARASAAGGDPMTFVKNTVGQILEVLQDKQTPQQARARKVIEIVDGRLDFSAMARSSLGYNWKKLRPDQQQQFVPLFTAFMEDAYISKISNYSGQKVQYVGQTSVGDGDAEVKTVVMPADASQQPIRINYMLSQSGGDWKVYDITVDDISITANYRNQFNHMINEQGFDALMSAMRDKQQALRQSIGA